MGKRGWEEEKLTDCLNRILHEAVCEEYYLRPEVAGMAGLEERMPPEILLRCLLRQIPCLEYLCCIGWEEEQELLQELLDPYFTRINHVNIVTDRPQAYEEFAEYIYGEYGTPLYSMRQLDQNPGRGKDSGSGREKGLPHSMAGFTPGSGVRGFLVSRRKAEAVGEIPQGYEIFICCEIP